MYNKFMKSNEGYNSYILKLKGSNKKWKEMRKL